MRPHLPVKLLRAVIASLRRLTRTVGTATVITSSVVTFALSTTTAPPALADETVTEEIVEETDSTATPTIDYSIYSGTIYTWTGTGSDAPRFANGGMSSTTPTTTTDENGTVTTLSYGDDSSSWSVFNNNNQNNTLRFVAPGSTVGEIAVSSTALNVYCDFNTPRLGGLIVESGAVGYTLRAGANASGGVSNNGRSINIGQSTQTTSTVYFTIHEDFNLGNSANKWSAVTVNKDWSIQVADGKTLHVYGTTITGNSKNLTIGSKAYTGSVIWYNTNVSTFGAFSLDGGSLTISSSGSGLTATSVSIAENSNLTMVGALTASTGNVTMGAGSVTSVASLTATAGNITANGSLTVSGALTATAGDVTIGSTGNATVGSLAVSSGHSVSVQGSLTVNSG
jgi:hypothetical protein